VLKHLKDACVYSLNDEFMLGDALLVAPILTEHTFEREVYLPAGRWCELLTGKTIEGRRTVTVTATLGQLPLFLDLDSPDAKELLPIFKGLTWNEIKRAR
jgi:alpha-glucosidase